MIDVDYSNQCAHCNAFNERKERRPVVRVAGVPFCVGCLSVAIRAAEAHAALCDLRERVKR